MLRFRQDSPTLEGGTTVADTYKGPDRRREQRRKKTDRREEVRFEPDLEDRRKNNGQRRDDKLFGGRN
jgi:hypothetical protein